jgi:site-specific recombinase XerC
VPTPALAPRGLPAETVKALLRATRPEKDAMIRQRDEAALALLIYGGLRVQEGVGVDSVWIGHLPYFLDSFEQLARLRWAKG